MRCLRGQPSHGSMGCSRFSITLIVVVVLSNFTFGALSIWYVHTRTTNTKGSSVDSRYSTKPYSWFTKTVDTEGPENYKQDDIKTLLGNYSQPDYTTNPDLWLCIGIATMNRFGIIHIFINTNVTITPQYTTTHSNK